MTNVKIPSGDGMHQLHVVIWEPETSVKAVLQISHGMIEYIERYDEFAGYLNERGIAVIGNDHLGHGHTVNNEAELGYFCKRNMSATVVNDLYAVTKYAKKKYPDVPYFLLGHSMGSFMARRYLMTYGSCLTGAIICGTGRQPGMALLAGRLICAAIGAVKGENYRPEFVRKVCFGSYNERFEPAETENDWLTKDKAVVRAYNSNRLCTFSFTVNGYKTLFEVLSYIQNKRNIERIPKELPVFMIAGEEDPVGDYSKGVKSVYYTYKKAGVRNISLKLYPGDRHEILNETDKEKVYGDVYAWLDRTMQTEVEGKCRSKEC